ncbi:DUF4158 domain-containing protein [Streptomyces sp. NPDC056161]|uniref:DUF4158 domain-containing protein n=1 Tax=Streptomyces sp. NPDC056161 TaxID=3345732 RepID=UPI0035D6CB49
MTSIERTAYPRFERLITARELHVFFTPSEEERVWAEEVTDSGEHQLALLVALKSYQRMGCFPKVYDVPDQVVEFVRRAVELPESTLPVYASGRTAERYRPWVRERCGVRCGGPAARTLAEETMRAEAASENNPADLINIALEKLVEAGLEIPRFSTLDAMASAVRGRVNEEILAGIQSRMTEEERRRALGLPDMIGLDRKTLFNALKQNPGRASWSNFKKLKDHLEWVDGLGDTGKWLEGVASAKEGRGLRRRGGGPGRRRLEGLHRRQAEQLLPWEQVEAKLSEYLVEVGLREAGEATPFDGRALVAHLRARLTAAAAKADGDYLDNDELCIDPDTGVPKLKPRRAAPRRAAPRSRGQARCGWSKRSRNGCRSGHCLASWRVPPTGSSGGTGSGRPPATTRS